MRAVSETVTGTPSIRVDAATASASNARRNLPLHRREMIRSSNLNAHSSSCRVRCIVEFFSKGKSIR
jgi:hypothetical protein